MSRKAHGQVRRGQVITTYGPGALIDLPKDSAIVGGLETWPKISDLEEIEQRIGRKLQLMTGVAMPRLYAPPPVSNDPRDPTRGIGAWRFPEWFIVQEGGGSEKRERSRRLVHRKALDDKGRFDGQRVVATRFVRACPKGHVDDLRWSRFAHYGEDNCRRQLWLDERGTSGDLADLVVRCECGKSRGLYEASAIELNALGTCSGARPWLGRNSNEDCNLPSRLLIRTASNAYFPQVMSVLSLPDRGSAVETTAKELWDDLSVVTTNALSGSRPRRHNIQYREIRRSSSSRWANRPANKRGLSPVFAPRRAGNGVNKTERMQLSDGSSLEGERAQ